MSEERNTDCDWEEDFSQENGNYLNSCLGCDVDFLGHKRREICKVCQTELDELWDSMTESEQRAAIAKDRKAIRDQLDDFYGEKK